MILVSWYWSDFRNVVKKLKNESKCRFSLSIIVHFLMWLSSIICFYFLVILHSPCLSCLCLCRCFSFFFKFLVNLFPVLISGLHFCFQGTLWILEPDKIPKSRHEDKVPKEQRRKKEILEVTPVRKNARIRDHYLILMEADVSCVEIPLRGCTIVAVSATDLPSRKW